MFEPNTCELLAVEMLSLSGVEMTVRLMRGTATESSRLPVTVTFVPPLNMYTQCLTYETSSCSTFISTTVMRNITFAVCLLGASPPKLISGFG